MGEQRETNPHRSAQLNCNTPSHGMEPALWAGKGSGVNAGDGNGRDAGCTPYSQRGGEAFASSTCRRGSDMHALPPARGGIRRTPAEAEKGTACGTLRLWENANHSQGQEGGGIRRTPTTEQAAARGIRMIIIFCSQELHRFQPTTPRQAWAFHAPIAGHCKRQFAIAGNCRRTDPYPPLLVVGRPTIGGAEGATQANC